jgi:IS30 family transposase
LGVDLVIGKGHKGGFATLAERKSRLYLALIIFAIAFSIFLMLMAQVFVKCSAYRFVLQDKAVGGKQANRLADERHQEKNKAIKLTDSVKNYISEKLKEYWSPEQIMGRLELDKKIKIAYSYAQQEWQSHLCVLYQ